MCDVLQNGTEEKRSEISCPEVGRQVHRCSSVPVYRQTVRASIRRSACAISIRERQARARLGQRPGTELTSMKIKIRDAIKGVKAVSYEQKPELWLNKCDSCGRLFGMERWCNDVLDPGRIFGTFDRVYRDRGNMFFATACSLECAHKIFTGGWKTMNEYRGYAKAGAKLMRVEIGITALFVPEDEAVKTWESRQKSNS